MSSEFDGIVAVKAFKELGVGVVTMKQRRNCHIVIDVFKFVERTRLYLQQLHC